MSWTPMHLLFYGGLLLVASGCDLVSRRIPNAIVLPLAAAGVVAQLMSGRAAGLLSGVAAGAIVFALLWWSWTNGRLGGGDLKLATASALWLEPARLPVFVLAGALAGGAIAVAVLGAALVGKARRARAGLALAGPGAADLPTEPGPGEVKRRTIPYALAIAAGSFAAVLWRA